MMVESAVEEESEGEGSGLCGVAGREGEVGEEGAEVEATKGNVRMDRSITTSALLEGFSEEDGGDTEGRRRRGVG